MKIRNGNAHHSRGFTLIELLTVIAIIGILAGILIPAIAGVQENGRQTKTQTELQQMATALNQYRTTYRTWPAFARGAGEIDLQANLEAFHVSLTGLRPNGSAPSGDLLAQNRKRQRFHEFGDILVNNGSDYALQDANLNTDIFLAVDANNNGIVETTEGAPEDDVNASVILWTEESDGNIWAATWDR